MHENLVSVVPPMDAHGLHWVPYGPHAALIHFANQVGDEAYERGRALAAALEDSPPPGLMEYVPAFTTLLLEFDPHDVPDVAEAMRELWPALMKAAAYPQQPPPIKEIPVIYDGEDLVSVARAHDLTSQEVRDRHSAPVYKVYMLGFAPGFPYLGDLDPTLHTPRLDSPRRKVPAGSVAIGGAHTGIYPLEGPGGWNIIGRTTIPMCQPGWAWASGTPDEAFFLKAGDRVRFVPRDKGP